MPSIIQFLEELEFVTIVEFEWIEAWLRRHHRHKHFRPATGRFGPFVNLITGDIAMALVAGQPYTSLIVFLNDQGVPGAGPIGEVTFSDPSITGALSNDGQAVNVTMSAVLPAPALVTWHDTRDPASLPDGESLIPDFSAPLDDEPPAFVAVSGSFGPFVPGTTD